MIFHLVLVKYSCQVLPKLTHTAPKIKLICIKLDHSGLNFKGQVPSYEAEKDLLN